MPMIARLVSALVLLLTVSAAQAQNEAPSERALEVLVKASLMSFNDANMSGNYTVFHARLSGPFRRQFSPERLKETFKEFSERNVDIDVVAVLKPVYAAPAAVDSGGKLLVKGYFPTKPLRLNFELDFIPSDGEWRLIRINVKVDSPP